MRGAQLAGICQHSARLDLTEPVLACSRAPLHPRGTQGLLSQRDRGVYTVPMIDLHMQTANTLITLPVVLCIGEVPFLKLIALCTIAPAKHGTTQEICFVPMMLGMLILRAEPDARPGSKSVAPTAVHESTGTADELCQLRPRRERPHLDVRTVCDYHKTWPDASQRLAAHETLFDSQSLMAAR